MKEIYDWVPWFRNLARRIAEDGPELLIERAKRVQWREPGSEAPLLKYGDENIDPFSFFYYLAGHNAWAKSRARVYPSIAEHFQVPDPEHLDRDEASVFPTPRLVKVLFHDQGRGDPRLLWKLFRQAASGVDSVAATDFENSLKIPQVALAKLTQVLFLVNPEEFLPFDKVTLSLGIATLSKPVEIEWSRYREELRSIRGAFPGCSPYEINLLAYLRNTNGLAINRRRYFRSAPTSTGKAITGRTSGTTTGSTPGAAAPGEVGAARRRMRLVATTLSTNPSRATWCSFGTGVRDGGWASSTGTTTSRGSRRTADCTSYG